MSGERVAKLVIRTHGGSRYEFPLDQEVTTIGRGRDRDLILDNDRFASRHHARIEHSADHWVLIDEGSTNGTSVGGRRISGSHRLRDGEEVQIGDAVLFYRERDAEDDTGSTLKKTLQQARSPIQVDGQTWEVSVNGQKLPGKLSVREFKLLAYLYDHADKVCTRDELIDAIWGGQDYTYDALHQLVHRVKQRVEPDPKNPCYIVSVAGVGYKLTCTPPP
jgi:hypothetical protein